MASARVFGIASSVGAGVAVAIAVLATFGPPRISRAASLPVSAREGDEACLSVVVTTTESRLGSDGVRQESEHRDRLVRCDGHVWIERIVPAGAPPTPAAEHGHDLPPLHTFARLIEKQRDGTASIALVGRQQQLVVDVDPASFDLVGFSGDWESAAHLVAPGRLGRFAPSGRAAPPGARWYERRDDSGTVAVLWSARIGFALAMETKRADGAASSRVAVDELASGPTAMPWRGLEGFPHKNVADFGD